MKAAALGLLFAGALALTTSGVINQAYGQLVDEAQAAPKGGGDKGGGDKGGGGDRGGGDRGGNRGGDGARSVGGDNRAPSVTREFNRGGDNRSQLNRDMNRGDNRQPMNRDLNRGQTSRDFTNRPNEPPRYQVNRPNFDVDRTRDRDGDRDRNWDRYGKNWGGKDGDWHRDNDWRYRWYGDRWWYWLPTGRWAYWYGNRWNDYYYDSPSVTVYQNPPDDNRWRYKYVDGVWWYYMPDGRWVYWMNGRWNEAPPAPIS